MEKKKVMLSQPMAGKTDAEIIATRERAVAFLEAKGYEVVNTLFTDEWYSKEAMQERGVVQIPLCFLAKSLENMSLCHAAYFCDGWGSARGCKIEHAAAKAYGLEILYEEVEASGAKEVSADEAARKITVEYEDGSVEELDKGLVFRFENEDEDTDTALITAELVNMTGRDLYTVVSASVELGVKLGMFGGKEGQTDEEGE